MSCTLIHHGHIRLLKKAALLGKVIVALTTDEEIKQKKGYSPELNYDERSEIISSIRYVDAVIPSNWLIDDRFILENKIDILVHGDDNSNNVTACEIVVYPRTEGISSSLIRGKVGQVLEYLTKEED